MKKWKRSISVYILMLRKNNIRDPIQKRAFLMNCLGPERIDLFNKL